MEGINPYFLIALFRAVALSAMERKLITYNEAQLRSGLSRSGAHIATYCGLLGDFCKYLKIPVLNSIVVDCHTCYPNDDCPDKLKSQETLEAEMISCFSYWNGPKNKKHGLTGINEKIRDWLDERK
jgi:hypothetical protein